MNPFLSRCAIGAAAVCLSLAGCGSAPPERVHSLLSGAAEPVAPASAASGAPFVFVLAPVRLPPGVEGPQWLVRQSDGTLVRLEQDRWPASLREELRAAIADRLVRSGGIEARTAPGSAPGVRIDLDLRRFESTPGRGASVAGTFTLVPPTPVGVPSVAGVRCVYERSEAESGAAPALAAAHRRILDDLAVRIAAAARTGTSGTAC